MLNVAWFALAAMLFVFYFFLEGFDYGVGMLLPVIGRTDRERRLVLSTIGPFWDGNEVWLIAAGGTIFSAFPDWYASLLSSFYLGIFLLLIGLILRGVSIEFRSRIEAVQWKRVWDSLFVLGSFLPPLVWGLAMANLLKGIRLNAQGNYVGTLLQLVSPYSLLGALTVVLMFALHGALFLMIRTQGELHDRAQRAAYRLGPWTTAAFVAFVALSYYETDMVHRLGIDPGPIPVLAFFSMISVRLFLGRKEEVWAFVAAGLTIVLSTVTIFLAMFPDVLISSVDPRWSLTIYNSAANAYSLKVSAIMAVVLLPIVIIYQAWSYWVFRKRIDEHSKLEY